MNEAGLPPGVCNMVFGRGPTAGAALVKHPDVPLISFTGGSSIYNYNHMAVTVLFLKVPRQPMLS